MKIGYLGPIGSYSYEATLKYIDKNNINNKELIECQSISSTIISLEEGKVDVAIVPFENAIYGSVLDTMDLVLKYKDIYINDEIIIDINHKLMSKSKNEKIDKIYSHPQAIAQCQNYIDKYYNYCEVIPVSSTSFGAKLASSNTNTACICNEACKEIYNLEIIAENIQEIKDNQTRFIVISKDMHVKSSATKTSITFETKDRPGALYKILGLFSLTDINLTKIESRPKRTKLGNYMFFVDIEGNIEDERIKNVLEFVKDYCQEFRILGSY